MKFQDYYATLGVPRDAAEDDIKRAYRKLARKYHPDLNKAADAEAKFKELGEAYEVLKDAEKRAAYDDAGKRWGEGGSQQPPPGWDSGYEFRGAGPGGPGGPAGPGTAEDFADHSEFFEALFGRRGGGGGGGGGGDTWARQPPPRARDHHAKVLIDLADAYRGASRGIVLQVPQLDADGRLSMRERQLDVAIPVGVREGQHLRLAGQGAPGPEGSPAGDLYLEIHFKPHPLFRVEGRDVTLELPLAPWEAALGAEVNVPTPDGSVQMNIPAGSASGRKLRLKGKGIPGKQPGDLYVLLQIQMPRGDSAAAQQAWRDLAQAHADFNPRANLGS
ncbi:MAG: DnaJ C-terminal domain-containing protein [Rubrivivax sp.]